MVYHNPSSTGSQNHLYNLNNQGIFRSNVGISCRGLSTATALCFRKLGGGSTRASQIGSKSHSVGNSPF